MKLNMRKLNRYAIVVVAASFWAMLLGAPLIACRVLYGNWYLEGLTTAEQWKGMLLVVPIWLATTYVYSRLSGYLELRESRGDWDW
jgi:hypothetical protein